jgi:EmrB/QacA subfamily drug resistance transporter
MAGGPVLGGWLIETFSWRWIFFINVPVGAVVLVILWLGVAESRDERVRALDWWGALLATLGLGGLVFGLIESASAGLAAPPVVASLAVGFAALAAFVAVQARVRTPMMPLALFRARTFAGTNLLSLLLYAGLSGALFFVPFKLIQVHGYTATAAGAAFLPMTALIFALSGWAGGVADRRGPRLPLVVGPTIAAAGFALFALLAGDGRYWTGVLPPVALLGLGMAITVAPLTAAVMGAADARQAGVASGINNAVSRVGGLVAVAALGLLITAVFSARLEAALADLDLPAAARSTIEAERIRLAATTPPSGLDAALAAAVRGAVADAFVAGYRWVMAAGAALALASALVAAATLAGHGPARAVVPTES